MPGTIIIPVFNDWASIELLLPKIDKALGATARDCQVVLVDDGSEERMPPLRPSLPFAHIRRVQVLRLRRNLGHQRAIALGLLHVTESERPEFVIVMDGDGEDKPEHIPVLLDLFELTAGAKVVFAARTKRLETVMFRSFYRLYRALHRVLTGLPVRVGNFSLVPGCYLESLLVSSDIWNHYAAAVIRARIPVTEAPLERGQRLNGRSKMNFFSLVVHGVSAMSVFVDVISVRLMAVVAVSATLALGLAGVAAGLRFFTTEAIPGWATSAVGLLVALFLQLVLLMGMLVFLVMNGRDRMGFLLVRDGRYFLGDVTQAYPLF